MKLIKNNNVIFISAISAAVILLLVYIIRGVYPFGTNSISFCDMNQSFVPLYTRTWDVLHGKADFFFDWYTGCGNGTASNLSSFMISPFVLFFLFVKREFIYESMSYFLLLKITLMAASMSFYLKKTCPSGRAENIAAALLYTFSGYVVQYFLHIQFMDTLVFFPLLMYGFKRMARDDKPLLYTFMLVVTLVSGTYLAFVVLMFLLFYSFGYMYIVLEKDKRKKFAANLGLYTLIALCLSMVCVFPQVLKWVNSNRVQISENKGYLTKLKILKSLYFHNGYFMFFGCEVGIAAAAVMLINRKKYKVSKEHILSVFMMILLVIPIIVESSNLMWHFGSYVGAPYRYAFILSFISAKLFCGNTYGGKKAAFPGRAAMWGLLIPAVGFAVFFAVGVADFTMFDRFDYWRYFLLFFVLIAAYVLVFLFEEKNKRGVFVLVYTVVMSLIIMSGFISPIQNVENQTLGVTTTMSGFIKESIELDKELQIKNDNISRIKTVYPDMSMNWGLILQRPTLSSWINETSVGYRDQMRKFGYGNISTNMFAEGGTAFSDALLNVKYAVSRYPLNDKLYKKIQDVGELGVYESRYTLPFGALLSKNFFITSFPADGVKMQNLLYNNLTGTLENILTDAKVYFDHKQQTQAGEMYCYNLPVKGKSTLYVKTPYENTDTNYVFYINDRIVQLPYYASKDNYIYPMEYMNGFVELGTFENEDVHFAVISSDKDLEMLEIALLDNKRLEALNTALSRSCAENVAVNKHRMSMTADPECECFMFLPVEYDINWEAEVNGQKADIIPVLNKAFMAVDLPAGHCDIKLKYVPKNFYAGGAVSLVGLMLLLWTAERRREKLDWTNGKVLQYGAFACFNFAAIAALIIIYIIPLISWVIFSIGSLVR